MRKRVRREMNPNSQMTKLQEQRYEELVFMHGPVGRVISDATGEVRTDLRAAGREPMGCRDIQGSSSRVRTVLTFTAGRRSLRHPGTRTVARAGLSIATLGAPKSTGATAILRGAERRADKRRAGGRNSRAPAFAARPEFGQTEARSRASRSPAPVHSLRLAFWRSATWTLEGVV